MPIFVIEIVIDFSEQALLVLKNSVRNRQKPKNKHGYFSASGSAVQKIGTAQADFSGSDLD